MKIGIAGTGAVGGYTGGILSRTGCEVIFLTRGRHDQVMRQKGLRIETEKEGLIHVEQTFTDRPEDLRDADLVLFCVKSRDTRPLADVLAQVVRRDAMIVTLQNGVDQEETLAALFGKKRVLSAAAYLQVYIKEPGVVKQIGNDPFFVMGALDASRHEVAKQWADRLNRAGLTVTWTPHIMQEKWKKLIWNVTFNPLTAAVEAPVSHLLDHPGLRSVAESICKEAIHVAQKEGIPIDEHFADNILAAGERARGHKTSMLQDRLQGKPMEIDAICGHIVRRGEAHGVHTPVLNTVYQMLKYVNEHPHQERREKR
ncbi:MAG: 2-dehydropantoate 2-reductase [Bacillaceae bacterium]|nr:2-dehydropantoate 2-reductase [Bacillaceae bacterium]